MAQLEGRQSHRRHPTRGRPAHGIHPYLVYLTVIIAQFRIMSGTQPAGHPAGQSSFLANNLGVSQSGADSVRKFVGQSPDLTARLSLSQIESEPPSQPVGQSFVTSSSQPAKKQAIRPSTPPVSRPASPPFRQAVRQAAQQPNNLGTAGYQLAGMLYTAPLAVGFGGSSFATRRFLSTIDPSRVEMISEGGM